MSPETLWNCACPIVTLCFLVHWLVSFAELGHIRAELLHCPIVDEIELKLALVVEVFEESPQVNIVGLLVEAQVPAVCHIGRHLFRIPEAKRIDRCLDFALFDLLVLVLFIPCPEALPW